MRGTTRKRRLARLLAGLGATALFAGLAPGVASANHVTVPPEQPTSQVCQNVPADYEPFVDVTGNKFNIECLGFSGITVGGPRGRPANQYGPEILVERDEMASFIVRLLDTKVRLSTGQTALRSAPAFDGTNDFSDVPATIMTPQGQRPNPHYENINRLSQAGIVKGGPDGRPASIYAPDDRVKRRQMASFIARAEDYVLDGAVDGDGFPANPPDFFLDDEEPNGQPHENNINALAQAGIVVGTGPDRYSPDAGVTRDQMASFLVRLLGENFDRGNIRAITAGQGGPATALNLTPETDVNPIGAAHTVTATLVDAQGAPAQEGQTVRFEVYRDSDPSAAVGTFSLVPGASGFDTSTGGTADFTYGGTAATGGTTTNTQDVIVACVVPNRATGCTSPSGTLTRDPISGQFNNINQTPNDTAAKEFTGSRPAALTLTPETDVNPVGEPHTLSAAVTDQFGQPSRGQNVRFEVFIDTDSDGSFALATQPDTVTFNTTQETITGGTNDPVVGGPATNNPAGTATVTITGKVAGLYQVVACTDLDNDDVCARVSPTGGLPAGGNGPVTADPNEVFDNAFKTYVALTGATATANANETGRVREEGSGEGKVVNLPTPEAGYVDVFTSDNQFVEYDYISPDDVLRVNGVLVDNACFSAATDTGDTITVTGFNPAASTTYAVTDVNNSRTGAAACVGFF